MLSSATIDIGVRELNDAGELDFLMRYIAGNRYLCYALLLYPCIVSKTTRYANYYIANTYTVKLGHLFIKTIVAIIKAPNAVFQFLIIGSYFDL